MMNKLKIINLDTVMNENYIEEFFKCFDFFEEFDNKDYISDKYEFDYGYGWRKYLNVLYIFDVEINNSNGKNYILNNIEYVVAREIFNPNELVLLEKYCPCSKCLDLDTSKISPIYQNLFVNYCIGKYKTKIIVAPLVQEARKFKLVKEKEMTL